MYAVIGALQAGASVTMLQDARAGSAMAEWEIGGVCVGQALVCIHVLAGAAAALGGTYSTILFALSSLYGKTALGMQRDHIFAWFMQRTAQHRMRAFGSFTTSLMLFSLQIVLLGGFKSPEGCGMAMAAGLGLVVWHGRKDCNDLIAAATPIFTNRIPEE